MRWRVLVFLLVGLIVGILAIEGTFSDEGGFTLRAEFRDAEGLRSQFFVRIDGVDVGHVTNVTVSPQYTAIVTMHLSSSALPIGRDATATIRPDSFFGEHYVAIDPGNTEDPARSGMLIPLSRTATTPELDQLFDTFDPRTRLALGEFLGETGQMLVGRGHDVATAISMLPNTLDQADTLITNLGSDDRALGDLVDRSDQIVTTIAAQRGALGNLVDTAAATLKTTAAHNAGLKMTLDDAPAAVSQLRRTLSSLQSAATQLEPAATGLRATAPPLTAVLTRIPSLAAAAAPTLRAVDTAAPLLTRLAVTAAPVVTRLLGPTHELATFSTDLSPLSKALGGSLGNLLGYLQGYARAMQDDDGAGNLYRPAQTYYDATASSGSTSSEKRSPRHSRTHLVVPPLGHPQPAPTTTSTTSLHLPTLPKLHISLPASVTKPVQQTSTTITGLLHYLLGK